MSPALPGARRPAPGRRPGRMRTQGTARETVTAAASLRAAAVAGRPAAGRARARASRVRTNGSAESEWRPGDHGTAAAAGHVLLRCDAAVNSDSADAASEPPFKSVQVAQDPLSESAGIGARAQAVVLQGARGGLAATQR